ncbi:MAG: hypothetical protein KDA45_16820 [Planctomycetales bacterium]|nr:hypothetical protein [Planctomycetales bacterium]
MHTIRLRAPWQATWSQPSAGSSAEPPAESAAGTRPTVVYRRKFHRPSGLLADQEVTLIARAAAGSVAPPTAWLNARPLQFDSPAPQLYQTRVDLWLETFNRLELRFEFPGTIAESTLPPPLSHFAEIELRM